MKLIKATCQTPKCSYKGKTSEFISDIELTQCAQCGEIITNLVIEEIVNGTAEKTE
jgi:hypothetical protein